MYSWEKGQDLKSYMGTFLPFISQRFDDN